MELYYTDEGKYPVDTVTLGGSGAACLDLTTGFADTCIDAYMGMVPSDPGENDYAYVSADGATYTISATLEGDVNGLTGNIQATPSGITTNNAPAA